MGDKQSGCSLRAWLVIVSESEQGARGFNRMTRAKAVCLDAGAPEHVPSVFQRKRVNDQRLRVDELKLCVVDKGEQFA